MKRSSLGLDLYLWLTYRTFNLTRPMRLSWKQLYCQFGSNQVKASDPNTVNSFLRNACASEKDQGRLAGSALLDGEGRIAALALTPTYPARRHCASWNSRQRRVFAARLPCAWRSPPLYPPYPTVWPLDGLDELLSAAVGCFPQNPVILGSYQRSNAYTPKADSFGQTHTLGGRFLRSNAYVLM